MTYLSIYCSPHLREEPLHGVVHVRGERGTAGAGVGVDHLSEEDALPHGVTDIYSLSTISIRYASDVRNE